ncbi:hypothetical protein GQ54DRAFT_103009 [Martensiomyces pterosporus]|nr:hypothetical protein GQ54DRAFT_103009 [Martensiomyces pterosporus]
MALENLSEQRILMQSTTQSLQHSDDAQVGREVSQYIEQAKSARRCELDQVQEALQTLSRRLQAARGRVEASKAQREEKSHAETMQDLEREKQEAENGIAAQAEQQQKLAREIEALEAELGKLDENIEMSYTPDEAVLKLQILRGLGVEPLAGAETGELDRARVRSMESACVISVDEQVPGHQMASQLWDLCSM